MRSQSRATLPNSLLIAAVSGRALARSAVRAGLAPIVLDLFDDQDLPVKSSRIVRAGTTLRFSARRLLSAASELAPGLPLVYGAGFEGCPQTLFRLARARKLYGNSPETLAQINDARRFFALLDKLSIPHPDVSFAFPRSPDGWLAKKAGAAGGWHIRLAKFVRPGGEFYFQHSVAGRSLSVLFLADGRHARIIGFNETWTTGARARPYCYAGAIGRAPVAPAVQAVVVDAVERLVKAVRLIGVNGMDFVLQDERVQVLEINARPTATHELYDADFKDGLLAEHLKACVGELSLDCLQSRTVRASAVVYSEAPKVIPPSARWPAFAVDLPRAGTVIGSGAPICTVQAEGRDFAEVKREVLRRKSAINDVFVRKAA
ncbi:MAG TPA: ATP-grasp domain-containing protein [Burkholderiales bacterium]|nr:ATP-grasp domain-containing protein [Burkholderiales bacterium]